MNPIAEDILMHYGVKRRSGRYPFGSGKEPFQHSGDFLSRVDQLKANGFKETDIAKELGLSTTELRVQLQAAKHERRELLADRARSLREDGMSLQEIANEMGYKNDSSIRSLLNEDTAYNKSTAKLAAEKLKERMQDADMIDVGAYTEYELGISRTKMEEALNILEREGYNVYGIGVKQLPNEKQQTTVTVLAKPDIEYGYAYNHPLEVESYARYDQETNPHPNRLQYPSSLDSNRVYIRYGDEGGVDKDGVIEIRRGVDDLTLGNSHYAQVRILVDGTHYLKGMAVYSDDMPDGYDIVFNTNKKSGTSKQKVMKEIKDDPDNPFGAVIKTNGQTMYIDKKTGKAKLSPINKLKDEGDWANMDKNLSSQFLSKQPMSLIHKQLNLTYKDYVAEYDEISKLTNPTVKKKLLLDFADQCDGAALHLKAAALPRQSTQVLLPLTGIKDTEVYAPNYRNGEKVALVRYPHAGTFEIPILTVNNKNASGKKNIGSDVLDAIGISAKVAEQLSGADFDGDQVVVIPTNSKVKIKASKPLEELQNFNPKVEYSTEGKTGVKLMSKDNKQKQMGVVSNLITDMTLKGAPTEDMVKAVKHSMVVIDAEKHKLDYKKSQKDNDIDALKQKWQGGGGAATLLSKREQDTRVPERRGSAQIDPETGKISYKTSGRTYVDKKTGQTVEATTKVRLLSTVDDYRTLSSGTPQENAYADYGNKMKSLANQARKQYKSTGNLTYSAEAKKKYQAEVDNLNAQLNVALKNAPRERRAQLIANSVVKAKKDANPDMDKKERKKVAQIAIEDARQRTGASSKDRKITITDKAWEAIQAGAVSDTTLTKILKYADGTRVRELATPKTKTALSPAKVAKAKAMRDSGYTNAEIADSLGVSTSTVAKAFE